MSKPKIIAYLKPTCGWSQGVRAVMRKYDLPYEDRDIINDPLQRQEMIEKSGQMLSPCVEVNGRMLADVSGEEVEAFLLANRLVQQNERQPDAPINQACATSARCLSAAAEEIEAGAATATLVVTADRCSNGPMIYYPNPLGPGGAGVNENWVLDNFSNDPYAKVAMVDTAENCARKWQITTAEQHEVVLRRQAQYDEALADDAAFMKRYMELPFAVPDAVTEL